jgi:hypothetical protein
VLALHAPRSFLEGVDDENGRDGGQGPQTQGIGKIRHEERRQSMPNALRGFVSMSIAKSALDSPKCWRAFV